MRKSLIFVFLFGWIFLFGQEKAEEVAIVLSRADEIPCDSFEEASDTFYEGYIQALVDMHYYEFRVIVVVKDREVWLSNLPKNKLLSKSIVSFVSDIRGIKKVHIVEGIPPKKERKMHEKYQSCFKPKGIWFPQTTELFLPIIANPRQVTYSIGYRQDDKIFEIGKHAVPVSLGDDFPIYRWIDVGHHGDLQISIESGIWAVFNMNPPKPRINSGTALVNTDFYVGAPLTYAFDAWSFRFRAYHISSHLGDEFLVNNPGFVRVNPSYEAIDFFASYQLLGSLRVYAGTGAIVHSDPSFRMKPFYLEYGGEYRFLGSKFHKQKLYGTLFLGAHFRTYQYLHYDFDGTFVAGYEFSKLQGIGRKFRVFVEYHKGFSLEGQFMKERTSYWSYLLSYGF